MYILLPLLAFIKVLPFAFSNATPLVIPWNTTHSYGPDGPWPVITVQVGSINDATGMQPLSTVDLHPGGIWESMIIRGRFCNDNGTNFVDGSTQCLAEKAGLYNLSISETAQQNVTTEVGLVWQWGSQTAENVRGSAVNVLDTMTIPSLEGTFAVLNSTISAVSAWQIQLPDGTYYSAQVGILSLGAPATGMQIFNSTEIGQTIPGFAYAQDAVPSNSWGLHYGSASLNQEGSLVLGGYDQSRVLGDVGAFDLATETAGWKMIVNLLDVQIGVGTGSSPFGKNSYTGLLKLNANLNGLQQAVINPVVSYLFMSPETCAAVTENLPVTLNSQIGLYIWNTTDAQYETIVRSPAYLAFVFQNPGSGNITIRVPFQLLNLTLESPIVSTTQQYFPCRPFYASDDSGEYYLGKAFLQAAFLGMNWQVKKFFLAQAPGPGVGSSNIKSIDPNDIAISADPIQKFAETWERDWTALSETDIRNTTAVPTGTTKRPEGTSNTGNSKTVTTTPVGAIDGENRPSGSGMSSNTKGGIAGGVIGGALALAGVLLLSCLHRRRTAVPPQDQDMFRRQDIWVYEKDGNPGGHEVGEGLSHEADADHEIYEL